MAETFEQAQARLNPSGTPLTITGGVTNQNTGLDLGGGNYVETVDPQQQYYNGGTSNTGGYTGYSAPSGPSYTQGVNDPNTIAQYDQNIANTQAQYDRQGNMLNSGYGNIDTSYNGAIQKLLLAKNQANQVYDQNVLQTKQDYVGGKNTVRSRAGSSLNSLLRLLGSRGAGGSSAARITAPGAVARQGTLQQSDLANTFGHNIKGLDQNWGNYLTGYENERQSAWDQRGAQRQSLEGQIEGNRASLLQQLSALSGQRAAAQGGSSTAAAQPYLNQANAILDRTANYRTDPINLQTLAYTAPSLDKYTVGPGATPTFNGAAQGNDYTSPYLAALLGKKQQGALT